MVGKIRSKRRSALLTADHRALAARLPVAARAPEPGVPRPGEVAADIRKHLLKTGTDPGAIVAASSATGNLADWRDWDTPTLGP